MLVISMRVRVRAETSRYSRNIARPIRMIILSLTNSTIRTIPQTITPSVELPILILRPSSTLLLVLTATYDRRPMKLDR